MKKQLCAIAITSLLSTSAFADNIGVFAGIDYSTTNNSYSETDLKDSNNFSGYIAFEHFIPLIPNVKLKHATLNIEHENADQESSMSNAILYYQLFDNGMFEFDFGLAYTHAEDLSSQNTNLLQGYLAAKVQLPGLPMNVFAEGTTGSLTSDNATDAMLGVAYTFNPNSVLLNFSVRAGYRMQDMTINSVKQENKGLFAGVEVHF
ncbi:hypothetical protein PCNPT3_11935 [Psychromonas sp. CNPT3]|uniref:TIGR04219 family outer membrane beta-barrel protein n=1 Tax=Psychromonas sp. CNPT3 TaxID=314282 RepID=UPI00006E5393|nr:TIGR04219 family outer membrane beta-barrel protein [Psychromonas sp. CNPT3]AGH82323.1 hypothetical protein PCNPT3_11935 [Psychromonas sp. CNPT3]